MQRVSGYVKSKLNFSIGCIQGDYAHAYAPKDWFSFEAKTASCEYEATGYMVSAVSGKSLYLFAETYSNTPDEAIRKGVVILSRYKTIKGPIDYAPPVIVEYID